MSASLTQIVQDVRSASRKLVRELGFMNRYIAETRLTPSQVHALIEIGASPKLQAAKLKELLGLDKSATSRLIADLVKRGYVRGLSNGADARVKPLVLTAKGEAMTDDIHATANRRVTAALRGLKAAQQVVVADGLHLYSGALYSARSGDRVPAVSNVDIRSGYTPGIVGEVVTLHSRYYSQRMGFGLLFEKLVAAELAEFLERFDADNDVFLTAWHGDSLIGSIAIDASRRASKGARLRWFFVDESHQGTGLGNRLLQQAIAHCDKRKFKKLYLTTIEGLDAARHLYEKYGFMLTKENTNTHWGRKKLEQWFTRQRVRSGKRNQGSRGCAVIDRRHSAS